MRLCCALLACLAISLPLPVRGATNTALISAVSVTRQFTAYAPSSTLPPALCIFAERTKREWLNLLGMSDGPREEILIVVRERNSVTAGRPAVAIGIIRFGSALRYEIDAYVPPTLDELTLGGAIVEALCVEYANRKHPPNANFPWKNPAIPPWLSQGLTESIHGRKEWLLSVASRAALSARPPSAREILSVPSLPAGEVDREMFSANAWLLVDGLLRLPNGQRKMQQFLNGIQASTSAADLFNEVYSGDFSDEQALAKWWIQQQGRLETVVLAQNWSAAETAKRVEEMLTFSNGLKLDGLLKHSDEAVVRAELPDRIKGLQAILQRAHPIYRATLGAYIEAGQWLSQGKLSRYRRTAAEARSLQTDAEGQAKAIASAMDEAEQKYASDVSTNSFRNYFQMLNELETFERQRRNPISDYLDQFDK